MSAGYRCLCLKCQETGRRAVYEGETGQSGFLRQQVHSKTVEGRKVANAIAKHNEIEHEGRQEQFEMVPA
jgi:hypothetical protein